MKIEVINAEQSELIPLQKAIEKIFRQGFPAERVEIYCQVRGQRDFPQWLEYTICFYMEDEDRPKMVIGMIQRTADAEFEFHS